MAAVRDVTPLVRIPEDDNPFAKAPAGDNVFAKITDNVCRVDEAPRPPRAWYIASAFALGLLGLFFISTNWAVWTGIGVWGNMVPGVRAFPIVNFVFWIDIGHAGKR